MLEEPIVERLPNPEDTILAEENHKQKQTTPTPKKCVCEICTCGMHHCPRPRIRGIFETTYKHDYQKYAQRKPPPEPPRQEYKIRHYDKSTLVTSYDDYNKTSDMIRRRKEERAAYQSQNKNQKSIFENSAKAMLRLGPKFLGVSEYKDHFKQFPQREKSLPAHYSLPNIPMRFEGESSYKKDYVPHPTSPSGKNLETIEVEVRSPPSNKRFVSPKVKADCLEEFAEGQSRLKTMPDVYSPQRCPCELMRIPSRNETDHMHLKYDPVRKQWE